MALRTTNTHQDNTTWEKAIDALYDVRCDIVHEARYFEFHLAEGGDPYPTLTHWSGGDGIAHMSLSQLRRIILEGAARGVQMLLAQMPGL